MESDGYSTSAWRGEIPENTEIVDDSEDVFESYTQPKWVMNNIKPFYRLALLMGIALFLATIIFTICAFSHGLYWGKIVNDEDAFLSFIIFLSTGLVFFLSIFYIVKKQKKYGDFSLYERELKVKYSKSKYTGGWGYTQLFHTKEYFLLPNGFLYLSTITPNKWIKNGFKKYRGKKLFFWNEEKLIKYNFHQSLLLRNIKYFNWFNYIFIVFIWPSAIIQMKTEPVFLPAYFIVLGLSLILLLVRQLTKRIGTHYEEIVFNRLDGTVTYNDIGYGGWCCNFTDLNVYIYYEAPSVDGKFYRPSTNCLDLLPRYPQEGVPRRSYRFHSDWCHIGSNWDSAVETWSVINQFMNVKAPLPFVLPLEHVRNNDLKSKRSRVHQRHGAVLKNLRSLSDSDYKALLKQHIKTKFTVK